MISNISGILVGVDDEAAYVESQGLVYQVLVPAAAKGTLAGSLTKGNGKVSLCTIHYIEGGFSTGAMVPRLIGFLTRQDREFFRVFTSVQGVGIRKALRAFAVPAEQIIRAIQSGNAAMLVQLPEIGKKTADRLISELKDKLAKFAVEPEHGEAPTTRADDELTDEARLLLIQQLHYSKAEADAMIANVLKDSTDFASPQELLLEIFRRKKQGT